MLRVTAKEFQKKFGLYRNKAQAETLYITHHGRADVVLVSLKNYQKLHFKAYGYVVDDYQDWTDEEIKAEIEMTRPTKEMLASWDDDESAQEGS